MKTIGRRPRASRRATSAGTESTFALCAEHRARVEHVYGSQPSESRDASRSESASTWPP
jgi:hypothetical protein